MILSSRGVLTGEPFAPGPLGLSSSGQGPWAWWGYGGHWGSSPCSHLPFSASLDLAPEGPRPQLAFC